MKFKITGDASFEYAQRWKIILSFAFVWGFLDLIDSDTHFCSSEKDLYTGTGISRCRG